MEQEIINPYIFVSYSHKDSNFTISIINRLKKEGYHVWYDDGIDPGTEWDENIANHIENCSYFVAVISNNYLQSDNCKDELNYSRDLNKNRLLVYIEECTLPSGMAMRLNRLQSIHKYKYKAEEDFYKKLFTANNINICKRASNSSNNQFYIVNTDLKKRLFFKNMLSELNVGNCESMTCEEFTNELVNSIYSNKCDEFLSRLKNTDLLVLEDIQFTIGKTQTQETLYDLLKTRFEKSTPTIVIAGRDVNFENGLQNIIDVMQKLSINNIDKNNEQMQNLLKAIKTHTRSSSIKNTKKGIENKYTKMGIIALPGCEDLVTAIEKKLSNSETSIISAKFPRSSAGEGACIIEQDIKNKDLFIFCNPYNKECSYMMGNLLVPMNPDAHYTNLKNTINAVDGCANRITVVLSRIYDGLMSHDLSERKDILDELFVNLKVDLIVTFDANGDSKYSQQIRNLMPYEELANTLTEIADKKIFNKELSFVVSFGNESERRGKTYSELLGLAMGTISRVYDYSRTVYGRHPVVDMKLTEDISKYQNIVLVTDVFSSVNLMECCRIIKSQGVKRIYIIATFGNFSGNIENLDISYNNNLFDKIICTNLTHAEDELLCREWYTEVDISSSISDYIHKLHKDIV